MTFNTLNMLLSREGSICLSHIVFPQSEQVGLFVT